MKKFSAAIVCVLLLLANLFKYWPEGADDVSAKQDVGGEQSSLEDLTRFGRNYQIGGIDLFKNGGGEERSGKNVVNENVEPVDSSPLKKEVAADTTSHLEGGSGHLPRRAGLELLSVAEISGVKKGLVRYRGKHYFVSPGDVIDGRYVVQKIDGKKVYLSSVVGSGSL